MTKGRIALYLTVIFLAGAVTGAAVGRGRFHRPPPAPRSPQQVCVHILNHLKTELGLRPDQVRQIEPLLERRARDIEGIQGRTMDEIEGVIRDSNREIVKVLDAAQAETFTRLEQQRQERMRRRYPPPDKPLEPPGGSR